MFDGLLLSFLPELFLLSEPEFLFLPKESRYCELLYILAPAYAVEADLLWCELFDL